MRIGAVSYLNTKPLVCGLSEVLPNADLRFDLPSRLADALHQGALDVALIPSIEFLRNPNYQIVSDACIACRGPVLSVKLFSRVRLEEVRTLSLDEGSRTSAALVQIMLSELHGVKPELHSLPIGSGLNEASTDAVLLIGDRAIHPTPGPYCEVWDLGEHWVNQYHCPFVFAVWAAREDVGDRMGADLNLLSRALGMARDQGTQTLDQIADQEHEIVGLSVDRCHEYLAKHLYFTLGESEMNGLELYRRKARSFGFIQHDTPIRVYDCETA